MSIEDVNLITIQPGESGTISLCGSAAFGLGIEGMLDLYLNNDNHVASIYWYGPWKRVGNQFHVKNMDTENYAVIASVPRYKGILGDLSVSVSGVDPNDLL